MQNERANDMSNQAGKQEPIKLLFVCHGNICRSPMAERVMKHLVAQAGLVDKYEIASAAMQTDAIGSPLYPPARRELAAHGIDGDGHRARLMTKADYAHYDLVLGMDEENRDDFMWLTGNDPDGKFRLLMSYTGVNRDVADPWYTRDFTATWNDVWSGCSALLAQLEAR